MSEEQEQPREGPLGHGSGTTAELPPPPALTSSPLEDPDLPLPPPPSFADATSPVAIAALGPPPLDPPVEDLAARLAVVEARLQHVSAWAEHAAPFLPALPRPGQDRPIETRGRARMTPLMVPRRRTTSTATQTSPPSRSATSTTRTPVNMRPPAEHGTWRRGCWNCGVDGHSFNECPRPRRVFCVFCGTPGVPLSECPRSACRREYERRVEWRIEAHLRRGREPEK